MAGIITSVQQLFSSFVRGDRLVDGGDLLQMVKILASSARGLTANAGGGQVGALPLNAYINEVSVVAAANDSVMLPLAIPGLHVTVINDGANSCQVFGSPANPNNAGAGDTIAAHNTAAQAATAVGVAQAAASVAQYFCFALGEWKQLLTA